MNWMWINNTFEEKKWRRDVPLPEGWEKGRKPRSLEWIANIRAGVRRYLHFHPRQPTGRPVYTKGGGAPKKVKNMETNVVYGSITECLEAEQITEYKFRQGREKGKYRYQAAD